jgi:outer membrane protein with beta-barrel domain
MRGRWLAVCALSALSFVASASVASPASHPQERRGFWIGVGVGYGSAFATCDDCGPSKRESGGIGYVNLGGTLDDHLLLGVEISGWSKETGGVTLNLYNIFGTLTIHPRPSSGFFVKLGGGAAFMDTDIHAGSKTVTVDLGNGLGLLAGAGYDIRLWRNVSITPGVNFWYGRKFNSIFGSDTPQGTWSQNVVDVTLGITFH